MTSRSLTQTQWAQARESVLLISVHVGKEGLELAVSASARVRVSLFSLRLVFCTDPAEASRKNNFVHSPPGLLTTPESAAVKMTAGPGQVPRDFSSQVTPWRLRRGLSLAAQAAEGCVSVLWADLCGSKSLSVGMRIIVQPALPVSRVSTFLQNRLLLTETLILLCRGSLNFSALVGGIKIKDFETSSLHSHRLDIFSLP